MWFLVAIDYGYRFHRIIFFGYRFQSTDIGDVVFSMNTLSATHTIGDLQVDLFAKIHEKFVFSFKYKLCAANDDQYWAENVICLTKKC